MDGFAARLSAPTIVRVRWILRIAAVLGLALGIQSAVFHVSVDHFGDVRAYYDAGTRLNAGQALYVQVADTNEPGFYRYPPLLAILFRPLALLSFEAATIVWVLGLVALTGLLLRRLG